MIPLVGEIKELKYVKNIVVETADAEIKAAGVEMEYEVGTMIEVPRAALTADPVSYTHLSIWKGRDWKIYSNFESGGGICQYGKACYSDWM